MTTNFKVENSYYFIPFGRDRGGYLDLLGLPPTASIVEAKKAEVQYKKSIEKNFKAKRKELRAKLKSKELTQEEFNAQVKGWEIEKTGKYIELNKLNEKFKKALAEKRKQQNEGIKNTDIVWFDMYPAIDPEKPPASWFTGDTPLKQLSESELKSMKDFWIRPSSGPAPNISESSLIANEGHKNLTNFYLLLEEKKILCMLWSDTIWKKLSYTNRNFWNQEINKWNEELKNYGPQFDFSNEKQLRRTPIFSSLCSLSDLSIDKLQKEEIDTHAVIPERRNDKEQFDFKDFLAMMVKQRQNKNHQEEKSQLGDQEIEKFFQELFEDQEIPE